MGVARRAGPGQGPVVLYVAGLSVAATGLAVAAGRAGESQPGRPAWWALPVLGLLVAAAEFLYVGYRWDDHVEGVNLVEAVVAPLLFAFPPMAVMATVAAGQALGSALSRNAPLKSAFNVAQWTIAAGVGTALVAGTGSGTSARAAAAVALALVAVTLVNQALFTNVLVLAQRLRPREVLATLRPKLSRGWLAGFVCNVTLGLLFVLAWDATPYAVLLFPVPLLALHLAYRGYAAAVSEQSRLASLHRAADVLGASTESLDMVGPFLREVATGYQATTVELVLREEGGLRVHRWSGAVHRLDVSWQPADSPSFEGLLAVLPASARMRVDAADPLSCALRDAGWRDALSAPLIDDGRLLGALVVLDQVGIENARRGELSILEALAREAAGTLAKGRLREQFGALLRAEAATRSTVEQLQAAVMPARLRVDGAELAVSYVASDDTAPTGGDLYDWQLLPGGDVHVAVVDILGHGVGATKDALAVIHALRLLTLEGIPIGSVVARADELLCAQNPDLVATVVLGRFTPGTGLLRVAAGGHPPALVVTRDGEVTQLPAPGGAIGWPFAGSEGVAEVVLDPGDALVLYTDGLVEARKNILEGMESLVGHARAVAHLPVDRLADELVARALDGAARRDDSLALVLRRVPVTAPPTSAVWRGAPQPETVGSIRHEFGRWLATAGLPADDLLLVASELLTNAVRYASSEVVLSVALADEAVLLEVTDDGGGSLGLAERGRVAAPPAAERGRGLHIVRTLVDDITVLSTAEGSSLRCTMTYATLGVRVRDPRA